MNCITKRIKKPLNIIKHVRLTYLGDSHQETNTFRQYMTGARFYHVASHHWEDQPPHSRRLLTWCLQLLLKKRKVQDRTFPRLRLHLHCSQSSSCSCVSCWAAGYMGRTAKGDGAKDKQSSFQVLFNTSLQ